MEKVFREHIIYRNIIIVVHILAFSITFYLFHLSRQQQLDMYSKNQQDVLSDFIKTLNYSVEYKIHDIELLAQTKAAKEKDINTLKNDITTLKEHSNLDVIHYVDINGDIQVSSVFTPITNKNVADIYDECLDLSLLIQQAKNKRTTVISETITLKTGEKGIIISSPIFKDNIYQGSLIGVLTLNELNQYLFNTTRINSADIIIAIDRQGNYVFGPDSIIGSNFKNFIDESSLGYENYLAMMNGKRDTTKHYFPSHDKGSYSEYNSNKPIEKLATYAPVVIKGKFLWSVAIVTPISAILFTNIPYAVNILLLAIIGLIIIRSLSKYQKVYSENLVKETVILETNKNLISLTKLNEELSEQKESYEALWEENKQLYEDLKGAYLDIVNVLVKAIETKDHYTSGHCERVREIAKSIGVYLNLEMEELETLELAALLHDIGKIGIPESILNKKGKLDNGEYAIIKQHPQLGFEMLKGIPSLERINKIVLQHHERIDGKGYPQSLKGSEIDKLAKILNVADSIDAMLSTRPYRSANNLEYVLNELEVWSGTQFDEEAAQAAKITMVLYQLKEEITTNNHDYEESLGVS